MDDFARFFDNSLDLNGIATAEGYFRRVNIAWERTLGWTREEVSASPWLDFVHPEDRQSTIDAGQRLFEGDSIISFENRYRRKDGSYRLIQWHAETVGGEAYCSGRDVTEERQRLVRSANIETVDALRERGPWFFAIFDSAPFAMALTKVPEGVIVAVNEAFLTLFEFTRDEVLGRTSINLGISDAESRGRLAVGLRDRGSVRDFECVRHTKGGARVVLLLNADRITVEGSVYVLTSVRDITRATAATAELRALVDNLPELAWTARPDGFIEFYNRRWYDYTGTNYEAMQGWGWQSVHHPDELPRVMESWTRSIATRQAFDQAFPLRRKDGTFRWFLTRVAPIFDDAGEIIRWVGINTDIDDHRRDREQLHALNVNLEERVHARTSELSRTLLEREGLLREKTCLLQEVHHRVKNNLQMISSLLNLQARQIQDSPARAIFLETQGRVRSIALLHESLYQSDDLGRVDMKEYVDKLIATLRRTYGASGSGARFAISMDRIHLPVGVAVPCGLIVNELATNAMKHAFVDGRDGARNEILIEMRRVDDHITLLVGDNGRGFAGTIDPSRDETMGLTLVRDLSLQLRGHAAFETANGARCSVRFPAPTE